MNTFSRIKDYIIEAYREFLRVNWPTKQETTRLTLIVVGFSIGVALFLGALDLIFTLILDKVVS
ncbi:MAG: preprotein translocase subunit SecE [Candidatus Paceibacterota bacterium]